MTTTLTDTGRITIPAELRVQDHLRPGQKFTAKRTGQGTYLLRKLNEPIEPGLVEWLLACPHKGFFQSIPDC